MELTDFNSAPGLWRFKNVGLRGIHRNRLDNITVEILPGTTAVIGDSGAGKSSLLGLLVGLEQPDTGTLTRQIPLAPSEKTRLPVYWLPPGEGLWSPCTVEEHLTIVSPHHRDSHPQVGAIVEALDLTGFEKSRPEDLSQGERARLALARALCSEAKVLVLDEPLVHTSFNRHGDYWRFVRQFCIEKGTSLVIATHDLSVVRRDAPRVLILDQGTLQYAGDWREQKQELVGGVAGKVIARLQNGN